MLGEAAFQAEYQQNPVELSTALNITPSIVNARVGSYNQLELPNENVLFVCASTDLNPSKFFTTVVCAFMRDSTCRVIWHKFTPTKISQTLTEQEYYKAIYDALTRLGVELKKVSNSLPRPIQGWAVDCNGMNWNAALDFARNSMKLCGLSCCGFVGRASTQFRTKMSSRLKEAVGRTLLCADADEHKQHGTGRKWNYWDSDFYRENVHKGFLTSLGNLGSISWYKNGNHSKWAAQVAGERLLYKRDKPDGTIEYVWKEVGPEHDALDAIAQALAAFASQGYATAASGNTPTTMRRHQQFKKKRIRFV